MRPRRCRIATCLFTLVFPVASPVAPQALGQILRIPPIDEQVTPAQAEVLVQGRWGPGPGEFGKVDEASRPGPMDFAVTDDTLYVLDPVNARVQLFDLPGSFRGEIPIGTRTADFMCVDDCGNVTVLDAFVRRELKTFSASGELLTHSELPASIGLCSAIFVAGDRVYVEERHSQVYELSAARGQFGVPAAVVGTLPGRPLRSNRGTVDARKVGTRDVILQRETSTTLRFDRPVASIVALESDDSGRVYLAAACQPTPDGDPWKTDIVLVALEPGERIAGLIRMPNAYITDHYRKLFVSRAGDIIQMQTTEEGVRFVRWSLATPAKGGTSR
jgi:hypothetical protein